MSTLVFTLVAVIFSAHPSKNLPLTEPKTLLELIQASQVEGSRNSQVLDPLQDTVQNIHWKPKLVRSAPSLPWQRTKRLRLQRGPWAPGRQLEMDVLSTWREVAKASSKVYFAAHQPHWLAPRPDLPVVACFGRNNCCIRMDDC